MLPTRHTEAKLAKSRPNSGNTLLSALSCGVYYLTSCQRGLPKPPWRNGSKGAVRPVFTYIIFHSRSRKLHWPALRAVDARAVIVVGPGETQSPRATESTC